MGCVQAGRHGGGVQHCHTSPTCLLLGGEELRALAAATSLDEAALQARYRVFVSQHPGGELDRE